MGSKTSGSKVRYAVVGLGHIAQVAVLPAFKMTPELGNRRLDVRRSAKAEALWARNIGVAQCSRMKTTIMFSNWWTPCIWLYQTICTKNMRFVPRTLACMSCAKNRWR